MLESICSLRENVWCTTDDAKAFQEVIWGGMELITARRRNEDKIGYNGSISISDREGRGNISNSVGVASGLDQMVRKEIGEEVMNFGKKWQLEKPMDVDKCIDEELLNAKNSGRDIGEMECQKVISLDKICSEVDQGETVVGKYGGKYWGVT